MHVPRAMKLLSVAGTTDYTADECDCVSANMSYGLIPSTTESCTMYCKCVKGKGIAYECPAAEDPSIWICKSISSVATYRYDQCIGIFPGAMGGKSYLVKPILRWPNRLTASVKL